jgi:protein SCO1/2
MNTHPERTSPATGRRQSIRRSTAALAVALAGIAGAACGGDTAKPATVGVVRETALNVSAIRLADVTDPELRGRGLIENGELRMQSAPGRLLLVYFGFTNCPDVCPTTLADLRVALRDLEASERERVDIAFATVDPDRDNPETLNAYMGHFFDNYHVVRDVDANIRQATDAFLASYEIGTDDKGRVSVSHTAVLYAVDDAGDVVVEWPFGTTGESIAKDLRILLQGGDDV